MLFLIPLLTLPQSYINFRKGILEDGIFFLSSNENLSKFYLLCKRNFKPLTLQVLPTNRLRGFHRKKSRWKKVRGLIFLCIPKAKVDSQSRCRGSQEAAGVVSWLSHSADGKLGSGWEETFPLPAAICFGRIISIIRERKTLCQ